ncbi:MAG: hypothetical protein RQ826_17340 [Xanthomonadales bacterium]|nr:hypothetical protein [Xanthomonadales bacterium]
MSKKKEIRYIPAQRWRWLTPLYDPLLRWGMRENWGWAYPAAYPACWLGWSRMTCR